MFAIEVDSWKASDGMPGGIKEAVANRDRRVHGELHDALGLLECL